MLAIYKSILTLDIVLFSSLLLFYYIEKDEINYLIGYRTKRSMRNLENWKFSQHYFSKNWLISIPIILLTQLPILFDKRLDIVLLLSLLSFIIYTCYLIYVTEKKLKVLDKDNKL